MTNWKEDRDLQLAFSLHRSQQFGEAAKLYRKVIKRNPRNPHALHSLGLIEASAGNLTEAVSLMSRSLSVEPANLQFIENTATVLWQAGDYSAALDASLKGCRLDPSNLHLLYVSASSLLKLRRLDESLAQFDRILGVAPGQIAAMSERGIVLMEMKRFDAALDALEEAIALDPRHADAYLNKGTVHARLGRHDDAILAFQTALSRNPGLGTAWLGCGNSLFSLQRFGEAVTAYDNARSLNAEPDAVSIGRGNALFALRRFDEAMTSYDAALALRPDWAEAWVGRGNVFGILKQFDEALAAYDKALALDPQSSVAWVGRGVVFFELKRHKDAAAAYVEVLKIDPYYPFIKGRLLHQKMVACDWPGTAALIAEIEQDIVDGKFSAEPFGWQGLASSERSLQLCAQLYNKHKYPAKSGFVTVRPRTDRGKIRIGYSSGEFRDQATSHLIVGMLEHHDRERFDVYAIDSGWDDGSDTRRRITELVQRVVDIADLGDEAAARAVRDNDIDILVNLNGYFGKERTGMFSCRCAPVQVNYLGFPGTLGADYIDYIIADRHVIPEAHREFYLEKVVYLPHCYQANDSKKVIGDRAFERSECGLFDDAFVFCCFNNNYKITPDTFELWMRLLKAVDGSVLWLIEDNADAADSLRSEAAARGVDAARLIFAPRMPIADHLARHRLADLFLDTLPYNAHTTASDALWAGLPVLTQIGDTFAGRVAASLLHAIGLPELITGTARDYERLAIDLACHPERLASLRHKLAGNRLTMPLFDTRLFTAHIETAYTAMMERHRAGLPPDHIVVPA